VKGVLLDPPPADHNPGRLPQRIQTGVGLAISLIGLAAYLYLLGGLVWWLRFTAAGLPADEAITVVDDKRLLATGCKAMLFELIVLVTLMLMAWAAWRIVRRLRKVESEDELSAHERNPIAWAIVLFGICVGAISFVALLDNLLPVGDSLFGSTLLGTLAGGMTGALAGAFFDFESDLRAKLETPLILWAVSLFLGLLAFVLLAAPAGVLMIVIIALAHLGGRLSRLPSVRNPMHLIPGVLILGVAFGFIAAAYQATPPVTFARAVVALSNGGSITGGYVGETGGGVLLAECDPSEKEPTVGRSPNLRLVPSEEIEAVHLGGVRYAFDHGKDPSLLDLARYFYKRNGLKEKIATVSVDPRQERLTCGLTEAVAILDKTLILRGAVDTAARVRVHGKGDVLLDGEGIFPSDEAVEGSSTIAIPVTPRPWVFEEVTETGAAEVEVAIRYESEEGFAESRDAVLTFRRGIPIANAR
jgi:hypothetical protein